VAIPVTGKSAALAAPTAILVNGPARAMAAPAAIPLTSPALGGAAARTAPTDSSTNVSTLSLGTRPTLPPAAIPAVGAGASAGAPPATPDKRMLLLGIIAGGFLLLLFTSLGLAFYFAGRPDPATTRQAAVTPTNPQPGNDNRLDPSARGPQLSPMEDPSSGPQSRLNPEEQAKVDKAIDKGVDFLIRTQAKNGSWVGVGGRYVVGYAAFPGLTLLECGVPSQDPHVQDAARLVRAGVPTLRGTYELSLAILFLDRLGEPQDRPLIQTMALRLMAGQTNNGGWSYNCPILKPEDEKLFLKVLEDTRPRTTHDLFVPGERGSIPGLFVKDGQGDQPSKLLPSVGPDPSNPVVKPLGQDPSKGADSIDFKKALSELPPSLSKVPAVQPPIATDSLAGGDQSDNSNTQFAILALWAAGRHQVPMERALVRITQRFRRSQTAAGKWGYHFTTNGVAGGSPAMTGAGLLGLAVGHGLTASTASQAKDRKNVQDEAIQKGLQALSAHIGKPVGTPLNRPNGKVARTGINMYFMWTVERVGMLYNTPTIGDKDWYRWGTEQLLELQHDNGSWSPTGYPGSSITIDTSLALLFLKRANLAKDLSKKLEYVIEAKTLDSGK